VKARFQEIKGACEVLRDVGLGRKWEEVGARGLGAYGVPERNGDEVHRLVGETGVMSVKFRGDVRSLVKHSDDPEETVEHIKDLLMR
jgi:hypothetical protein